MKRDPKVHLPDPADFLREEPLTYTEWGVLVQGADGVEVGVGLTEHLARKIVETGENMTLIARDVTWQPWRVQGNEEKP